VKYSGEVLGSGPRSLKIALLGFMGCGKSSIGPLLAKRLAISYIDLDKLIELQEKITIREIFQHRGEANFRELEEIMLGKVARKPEAFVVSCGGGIVLSPKNRALLMKDFISVWIDVPLGELLHRLELQRAKRPLLADEDYRSKAAILLAERQKLYKAAARFRHVWKQGENASESAANIVEMIKLRS
jgi:shikimate kinase